MPRPYRQRPSPNAHMHAAVDRFSAAAQGQTADLHDATGALLEALAGAAQHQVTQAVGLLMDRHIELASRLDRLEEQVMLHQRHLKLLDLVEDTRAKERAVGQ